MVNKQLNIKLYKLLILSSKVFPILIALCYLLNVVLSYFGMNDVPLNYLGGMSFIPLLYLYITSYTLKLCNYHRIYLHYIVIVDIINILDFYHFIPLTNLEYMMVFLILFILAMFITLHLKLKKI